MPLGPDPERARTAVQRLADLRETAATGEEDVLASLVVTGEPRAQRVLDDWLDQVADTLRALAETADEVRSGLTAHAAHAVHPATDGDPVVDGATRPALREVER